jgi:hypothetical protein
MENTRLTPNLLTSIVLLTAVSASAAPPATRPVYATPADVVAAAQRANKEDDFETILNCQSPAGQQKMVKFVITIMARSPATRPADAERDAFELRHRLSDRTPRAGETPGQVVDRLIGDLPDSRAFLLDFMTQQKAIRAKRPPSTRPAPDLTNLVVSPDGLTATGDLSRRDPDGGTMSQHISFSKIDGSWLLNDMMFY